MITFSNCLPTEIKIRWRFSVLTLVLPHSTSGRFCYGKWDSSHFVWSWRGVSILGSILLSWDRRRNRDILVHYFVWPVIMFRSNSTERSILHMYIYLYISTPVMCRELGEEFLSYEAENVTLMIVEGLWMTCWMLRTIQVTMTMRRMTFIMTFHFRRLCKSKSSISPSSLPPQFSSRWTSIPRLSVPLSSCSVSDQTQKTDGWENCNLAWMEGCKILE